MLRIVTDGAADMPYEWLSDYDIQVIPINSILEIGFNIIVVFPEQ